MTFRKRDQAARDAQALARVRGALEGYRDGGADSVSIAHVLDLLNPRGRWSLGPRRPAGMPAPAGGPVPGADPLTGCRPVTAPGK